MNSVITAPSARHGLLDWKREVYGALVFYAKNREDDRIEREGEEGQATLGDIFAPLCDSTLAELAKCIDAKNEIVHNAQFLHALSTVPPELVASCVTNRAFLEAALKDVRPLFTAARLPEGLREAYIHTFRPHGVSIPSSTYTISRPLPFNVTAAFHPVPQGSLQVAPASPMEILKNTNPGAYEMLKKVVARYQK
ncbi:hypothetical protein AB0911_38325 [Streptomyces nigra]|uniref:hypothetical protein n=1 Tax=Streptomyces nigra TaxID=1827580 RepID=UPI0034541969